MAKVIGIDIGNYATKTSKRGIFESRVSIGHKKLNRNDIKVIYKGKEYTVGNKKGSLNIGDNKYFDEHYDICLLTAIAKSFDEQAIECNVVVGLPPDKFNSDVVEEVTEKLSKLGKQEIILLEDKTEIHKTILIKNAAVFCENAPVFLEPNKYENKKSLWIDIGGGTGDIAEFDGLECQKNNSTDNGMLSFYDDMKTQAQSKLKGIKLDTTHMEEMFDKDEYSIKGEIKDISFLKDIIRDRVRKFTSNLNQNYDTSIDELNIIGGGAEKLIGYFKEQYKNAKVPKDNQFLNALTYEKVGEQLWEE